MVRIRTISLVGLFCACRATVSTAPAAPVAPVAARVAPVAERPVVASPAELPRAVEYVSLAAGDHFACALRSDGAVWCWGSDAEGGLGDGEPLEDRAEPQAVAGLSDVTQLVASDNLACAVTRAGQLWCWGQDANDDRPAAVHAAPTRLADGDVIEAAVGDHGVVGLRSDGSVWLWSVAHPSSESPAPPVRVALGEAAHVATQGLGVCAALRAGPVECLVPATRASTGRRRRFEYEAGAVRSLVGGLHVLFVRRAGGAVDLYETNSLGELGAQPPGRFEGAGAVAQSEAGWIIAYGGRVASQVEDRMAPGNGVRTSRVSAESATVAGLREVRALALGENFACALVDGADLRCWGRNNHLQLAERGVDARSIPRGGAALTGVRDLYVTEHRVCALMARGPALCWGDDPGHASLLDDGLSAATLPTPRAALGDATSISGRWYTACAVSPDGELRCARMRHRDPSGGISYEEVVDVVPRSSPATSVAVTRESVCAALRDGTVACRTAASEEDLCASPIALTPVEGLARVTRVMPFGDATCALVEGEAPRCWGSDFEWGFITRVGAPAQPRPVARDDLGAVVSLAAGEGHACVVERGGAVRCWGRGRAGQLGAGVWSERATPVEVPGARGAVEVAVGRSHSCARMDSGTVRCWGDNGEGQLGDGSAMRGRSEPREVPGLDHVTRVVAAGDFTCALRDDGGVWCWGGAREGIYGDGVWVPHPRPMRVRGE